jgi:Ni/Fe-hydrogenase subunit HybB-like protein
LGVIVPAILFAITPLRKSPAVLFSGALMVVLFGVVLNRLNVGIIGLLPYTGNIYTPSWMEFVVTLTLVSLGVIAFGLAAKYLPVFPEEGEHAAH